MATLTEQSIIDSLDPTTPNLATMLHALTALRREVQEMKAGLGFAREDAVQGRTGPHVPGRIAHLENRAAKVIHQLAGLEADLERVLDA